ncbi:MAG: hypothetical protein ACMUHY_00420 [Thermoplasmatota archaeon]
MSQSSEDDEDAAINAGDRENDPVLRDVLPYSSDPSFIEAELVKARDSADPLSYIESRMGEVEGRRKGDLRILLNRLTRTRA